MLVYKAAVLLNHMDVESCSEAMDSLSLVASKKGVFDCDFAWLCLCVVWHICVLTFEGLFGVLL